MASPPYSLCLLSLLALRLVSLADSYDPFDPEGNITIKWDVMQLSEDGYIAMVTIHNYQLYRHVERPGWRIEWEWPGDEVIWEIRGAEATEQGNCSSFRGVLPHSCLRRPNVIDLLPGTPYNFQVQNCCKAGVLSSLTQNPKTSSASFQIQVGNSRFGNSHEVSVPGNFGLGLSGYTCGETKDSSPTRFSTGDKRRWTQALKTWKATCSYSQFMAAPAASCCVSFSAFYSQSIVECPHCSCGCQDGPAAAKCMGYGEKPPNIPLNNIGGHPIPSYVRCTGHMCPIQIHWHVQLSYREYWRLRVTITNYNAVHNYSEWNLVVRHPSFQSLKQVFSFNYGALHSYSPINDTVMFWGIPYYNDVLVQYGEIGNVQTEMLLRKGGEFTFDAGWAFPRRVLFNGEQCIMPPPDLYPPLPNSAIAINLSARTTFSLLFCIFFLHFLVNVIR